MKNPGKRKEEKGENFKTEFSWVKGKQKKLRANRIRRKYLRISQILDKCHLDQAKQVQSKMIVEHPTTVKWLQKSNVYCGFHLPFPKQFCAAHLPVMETIMVLETEAGEQYEVKYLPQLNRLSGGWKKFANDKNLELGDGVVFHLVEPTKFKVFVIRANSANALNLPAHLFHSVNHVKRSVSNKGNNNQLIIYRRGEPHQTAENYSPNGPRLRSRNAGGSMLLCKGIPFSNITSFEKFKSAIHDLLQNHELPYCALHDYYELCCSQNAFLHAHLFEGINPKLNGRVVTGAMKKIILDTVNLANALRSCKLSTFLHKYEKWDQALNAYETLGMNVSFLHARLHHLKNLASKAAAEKSRYKEAFHERRCAESEVRKVDGILPKLQRFEAIKAVKAEIRDLEVLLAEFEKFFCEYDAHIDALKLEAKNHELKFQEEVSSPW